MVPAFSIDLEQLRTSPSAGWCRVLSHVQLEREEGLKRKNEDMCKCRYTLCIAYMIYIMYVIAYILYIFLYIM